jgi:hypothetical protein
MMIALTARVYAQNTIHLKCHDSVQPISYIVDCLRFDQTFIPVFWDNIERKDILTTRIMKEEAIFTATTRLLIVFDGKLLLTQKEKCDGLSFIDQNNIETIERINKKEAIELYGKKGKYGALKITTQRSFL